MSQNLKGLGFTVVPFEQGFKNMSPASKELMRLALDGRLARAGHPVLAWMTDNITVQQYPAENIKPDKTKSTEEIDGIIALIMALDRAIRNGSEPAESVYDKRELLVI
ncbi:terminase TerL endonuclease subunit [Canibacter zhuwentaonis]|uniref:terminase TerL endonuclease subunit n=1 Tax=Canibacter zhuwentaonis TaxID=2837491 RepID=UPI002028A6E2|nr:terminase TerL endonuclease subunit [Canibacter zhuwentaonis]